MGGHSHLERRYFLTAPSPPFPLPTPHSPVPPPTPHPTHTQMNIAAELDEECVAKATPATHKVKELPAVEAFLRQRKYHEHFIIHGGLAAATK